MIRSTFFAGLLLTASHAAYAQQQRPDAGQQIQQIPQAPILRSQAPDIVIDRTRPAADAGPAGARLQVNALQLTGQTLFSEAELIAATGFTPGGALNLSDLRLLAAEIARYYNSRGYFLAQAYLPAQDIDDGVVTIAVIEGRYGAIELRNQTGLSDRVARGVLSGLDSGDTIANAPLERRLLLLSDIPGVAVRSTLSPGTEVGTSNLLVDVYPGRPITGSVEADNGGNYFTGEYRLGGSVYFNNPTGQGDVIGLRVLASDGGLLYGRASYQTQVGKGVIGAAYAHVEYELGREFKSLDADGSADIFSVFGAYPLIRSRSSNLYALAGADAKYFEDRTGATGMRDERNSRSLTAGFRGDHRDSLGGGGFNVFSAGITVGELDLETPAVRAADALTARRNGGFNKLQFSAARLQNVAGPLSLYAAVRGQLATDNLDSSEQMSLGGPYGVRAYPEGESYGDEGYVANLEARLLLPEWQTLPGRVQLIGFVDVGEVRIANDPWFDGPNHARRSGYGAGVTWSDLNDFYVTASYARKLGNAEATAAPDKSGRFWVQFVKLF